MQRRSFLKGVAALGLGAAAPAFGQTFPSGLIRTIVPYSASTPPDIIARIIVNAVSDGEGWTMSVEDKPGAVMTIGANEVLKQAADGHTLHSVTTPIAAVPALIVRYRKGFRPGSSRRHWLQRAGGQSAGAGSFGDGISVLVRRQATESRVY
jgi:tripartite-type tricarboxylate transporter receptor subunit TctC